ncbi:MAG TPA: hypothetical protein EYP10_05310, partial [Armatimonadetes bacterium]|nr:hypothetical protein [Armatimonadota bacterium]
FVDELATRFQHVWRTFQISYTDFIRTTQPRHKRAVRRFIEQIRKHSPDAIYPSHYEGWYCVLRRPFIPKMSCAMASAPSVVGKCNGCASQHFTSD